MGSDPRMEGLGVILYHTQVWQKAHALPNSDPNLWRQDDFGNVIYRPAYGNRNSQYGWEIDHVVPQAHGGSDELSNLRPLHWRQNASNGDTYLPGLFGLGQVAQTNSQSVGAHGIRSLGLFPEPAEIANALRGMYPTAF